MKKTPLLFLAFGLMFWAGCGEDEPIAPALPEITAEDITVSENVGTAAITLKLSAAPSSNVVFSYSTINGTAVGGSDFTAKENEIFIINAGSTTATLNITIKDDAVLEQTERFEVLFFNPVGATFKRSRVTITIEDDDTDDGIIIPTTGYTTPDNYAGYTLVWRDEFDGTTLSSNWVQEIGRGSSGWGNNELQYYRAENTIMKDGHVVIEAKQEGFGGAAYTSSRIKTQGRQSFKYGRIDIRAVLPKGRGLWPALWMLGDNITTVSWPACGEIDIMEIVGHEPNRLHGTVHWDSNGHANFGGSTVLASGDFSDEFNVFSVIWDATQIRWLLNDVQYHTIDITPNDLTEFHEKFFFIFNVAVGGNWPGSPDATTAFPQRMIVDYVRVFQ